MSSSGILTWNASNITIENVTFESIDIGVNIRHSTNVLIKRNHFALTNVGISIAFSKYVDIKGNTFNNTKASIFLNAIFSRTELQYLEKINIEDNYADGFPIRFS